MQNLLMQAGLISCSNAQMIGAAARTTQALSLLRGISTNSTPSMVHSQRSTPLGSESAPPKSSTRTGNPPKSFREFAAQPALQTDMFCFQVLW